ncbi:type II toxin-antitoxin system RelE/ParE family toxin [Rhizobium sp. NTR19]|uniref:Type II toxin-antitoxin system RelE/ParE family toxin n=1 Tax=Neorhizobium turbinariae TaxID=2937795 RepID=A0ABT0IUZ6_9HYPH|nr:type II toxin-antitoxin system RelE/ParE family toxin [Neorhizobium turbinariae]MCK8781669.1 type II toxin-antitoxin system RelE/ParE family toxin [Neorhizobium turbinariae]
MIDILQTDVYSSWFDRLRDERAKARINARIFRLSRGNAGDVKPIGSGISEMRIDYGPGYRIYFIRRGQTVILLLCGGDKSTQSTDIRSAKALADELRG